MEGKGGGHAGCLFATFAGAFPRVATLLAWTAVSNAVSRRRAGRWAAQDQSHQQQPYMPPPPGRYQQPMFQPPPQSYPQAPVYPPPPYQPQPAYEQPARPPAPAPAAPTPGPAAPASPPGAGDMTGQLSRLRQLGELKTQGILTDAEFEAQKRKVLGG